jgi:hypothetical protein
MVLPEGIELSTSPLPRECSTTELRQLMGTSPRRIERAKERRAEVLLLRAGGHCHKA